MGRKKDERRKVVLRVDHEWIFPLRALGDGNINRGIRLVIQEAIESARHTFAVETTTTKKLVPLTTEQRIALMDRLKAEQPQ